MLKLSSTLPSLLVIAGPTAVGKTHFAIELARRLGTIILSADSRQFYKELTIGTAKPSPHELLEVPHHFIGHLSIHDYYNISRFEQDALSLLKEVFPLHPVVIMVGGSGLYIDAVCRGIDNFPDPDPDVRDYLKKLYADEGIERLRELLIGKDPEYYKSVDISNPNRLMRALEVCLTTGLPYSEQRLNQPKERDFNSIKIALNLPRALLLERIHLRVDQMLHNGLLDEVRSLYSYRHLNALNTVGYNELFEYLDEKSSFDQAVENIKTNTRRYAKRQLTWFKRDKDYLWYEPSQSEDVLGLLS